MKEIMTMINDALPSIGAITLGYGTYRLIRYIVSKLKLKPLRAYIRKEVVIYLNELKDE